MVSLLSLWLPIVLSAVIIFLASWLLHMLVGHHRHDLSRLPQEDAVLDALRAIPPGDYGAPHVASPAQMRDAAWLEKRRRGPIVLLTLSAGSEPSMGKPLALWFLYLLLVALFCAYLASRTLSVGAPYLSVFRVVATVAFIGFALAQLQQSIWWQRRWSTTLMHVIDGLIYALLAGGVFGWLWPRG
jgi:hypothetical protein